MPFIPHTEAEVESMLATIGVQDIQALFDEVPEALKANRLDGLDEGISELELLQRLGARAEQDLAGPCFMGAGSYDHHIPAAVWDLTGRGEFMTAYTPYQAEASQGTLQLIYEYQSMMTELTAMDVSNASVYDGASGLAEAVLMAKRANRKSKSSRVLIPTTVSPLYREATHNIVHNQGIDIELLPMNADACLDLDALRAIEEAPAAVVLQQPNFFGHLEDVDALTDWAHERGALVIAVVNPLTLALLRPPGEWGTNGADIACGDGQPFGIPMSSGGPSFGFICTRQSLVRQLPGRIIGRTEDTDGKVGYALTLQAREQHIRRGKATSNICTNQGLLVTAATIHLALMGRCGLEEAASACVNNTRALVERLTSLPGVEEAYGSPYFHERVLRLPRPTAEVMPQLLEAGLVPGLELSEFFPELDDCLLICATEKRTQQEMDRYRAALAGALEANGGAA
ncbi:MAG: aminomethyl-transferring glycine dehydrogenase subunit GcvPA [Pseudomonadota bacterium]